MTTTMLIREPRVIEVLVPAGRYFLGDPCYAVRGAKWHDLLNSCACFSRPVGAVDGAEVLAFRTAWGDGTYHDNEGLQYPVDAGLIGLTPRALIEDENAVANCGRWIEFARPALCSRSDKGLLTFGILKIDTSDFDLCDDEEDEE